MKKIWICFLILAMVFSLGACGKAKAPESLKITLVTPDDGIYWSHIDTGCKEALGEIGAKKIAYTWWYPGSDESELSVNDYIAQAVDNGVGVLIYDPNHVDASAITAAINRGVYVISVGTAADASFELSADEKEAGEYAAAQVILSLTGQAVASGPIGLVTAGLPASDPRVEGFLEFLTDYPDFTIVKQDDSTQTGAFVENCLKEDAVALFVFSEADLFIAAEAVKDLEKKPVVSGFGGFSVETLDLIDNGTISSTIIDNPDNAGYKAMIAAYTLLTGGSVADHAILFSSVSITKTNSSKFRPSDIQPA